ncbi:MAG: NAD(P)H-binding protein [Dehalococcoidales bacterium]|nr:MAG: NAD(P)H-binding protein [Dehalococcoidales bacterium]
MSYTILVIGGTGLVGGAVARRLQKDGYHVKIMDRNIDSADDIHDNSVVWGDVLDRSSIEKALWGCSGIHISISEEIEREGVENIASVAADLGIERITYTSGTNVTESNRWSPIIEGKLMAEKAIQDSGVPYTIFRPTYFMENLPRFVQGKKAYVFGKNPISYHLVALDDYARMVSRSYQTEKAVNKIFHVHGPQAITLQEALERYCLAFHPEINRISVMPLRLVSFISTIRRNKRMKSAGELARLFAKVGELGDPTQANEILGEPAITLEEWVKDLETQIQPQLQSDFVTERGYYDEKVHGKQYTGVGI